jgi:hypothetical protein
MDFCVIVDPEEASDYLEASLILLSSRLGGASDGDRNLFPTLPVQAARGDLAQRFVHALPCLLQEFSSIGLPLRARRGRKEFRDRRRILCVHAPDITSLSPASPRLPSQFVMRHPGQQRHQLGRMVDVESSIGHAKEEASQHGLTNIRRIELTPQRRIGETSSHGDSDDRFELPNHLSRRVGISFPDAAH